MTHFPTKTNWIKNKRTNIVKRKKTEPNFRMSQFEKCTFVNYMGQQIRQTLAFINQKAGEQKLKKLPHNADIHKQIYKTKHDDDNNSGSNNILHNKFINKIIQMWGIKSVVNNQDMVD